MKLTEILRVRQRAGLKPEAIKHDTATIVGNFEGNDIWNIRTTKPYQEVFAIKKNNQIISQVFGRFWEHNNQQYFILGDTFTMPEHQRQGLATSLYMFLLKKNIKLMSDKQQTKRGEGLWNSIRKQHPDRVKILDITTGATHNIEDIPNNALYIDDSKETKQSERYRLVLEHFPNPMGIPEVGVGILNERVVYTNPNNCGEFV